MNRLYTILTPLCLLFALHAHAQENGKGSIVIHADPRLNTLLKKTHSLVSAQPLASNTRVSPPLPAPKPAIKEMPAPAPVPAPRKEAAAKQAAPQAAPPTPPAVHKEAPAKTFTGQGFRVQIYNGADRTKAMNAKAEFARHFPGVGTYLIYSAPNFKVRVGNYHNHSDAEGMLKEANSMFGPSMIVPDKIGK